MGTVGRPSKLDDLRAKRIVDAISKGLSRTAAASHARIARATLMDWLARGRDGEAPYAEFLDRVKEAEAKAEDTMVQAIRSAALSDPRYWQAAAWWLERARPSDWAKREPTQEQETERAEGGVEDLEIARFVVAALEGKERKAG